MRTPINSPLLQNEQPTQKASISPTTIETSQKLATALEPTKYAKQIDKYEETILEALEADFMELSPDRAQEVYEIFYYYFKGDGKNEKEYNHKDVRNKILEDVREDLPSVYDIHSQTLASLYMRKQSINRLFSVIENILEENTGENDTNEYE